MKNKNKILIPTDLSVVAGQAIRQAAVIAGKTDQTLTLLHVIDAKSVSLSGIEAELKTKAERILDEYGVDCEILLRKGNIFDVIPDIACNDCYNLMVIGTHGIKGIKQKLFGANILKLVQKIAFPSLVVQEESPIIDRFVKLVLPVSSHEFFNAEIDAALYFAKIYDTEIHLYSIYKAGFEWPEQLVKNIELATRSFEKNKIRFKRVKEDQNIYSQGYAKQTLNYAKSAGADFISMISLPSEEYFYFAQADKEMLLLNDHHIPVLCTGGMSRKT